MNRAVMIAACLASIASVASAACTREKLTESINACESLVNISQIKCDNKECHKALHVLVEADYIECYVQLGLGTAADLAKYKLLDDFCHGEGPDPTESNAAATKSNAATAKSNQTTTNSSMSSNKTASTVVTTTPVTVPTTAPAPTPSPSSAASAIATVSTAAVVFAATASVFASL